LVVGLSSPLLVLQNMLEVLRSHPRSLLVPLPLLLLLLLLVVVVVVTYCCRLYRRASNPD
jgi:hypothetical protein